MAATGDMVINGTLYADLRSTSEAGKDLISGLGAIKEQTKAEKEKSITPTQNITFGQGAKAYINGSIRAINLKVENGANVYAKENLFNNDNNGNAIINGNLYIGGFIKTHRLDVNGYLKAEEAVKVTDAFNVIDGANVYAKYINVTDNTKDGQKVIEKGNATLSLNGTGKIFIGNKNVITVNNLVTDNASDGQITLEGNDAVAVIKAHKLPIMAQARLKLWLHQVQTLHSYSSSRRITVDQNNITLSRIWISLLITQIMTRYQTQPLLTLRLLNRSTRNMVTSGLAILQPSQARQSLT